jgi:acyl-CoA thioester hydrolase
VLRIVTTLREKPSVRIKFEYDIFNSENTLIHQGETSLAFIDKLTNRPRRPPDAMQKVLEPFFK